MNPFARPRVKSKRTEPRRTGERVILHGEAKTAERRRIFERSSGKCEAIVRKELWGWTSNPLADGPIFVDARCNRPITWETMQWSHPRHGPYKDDRQGIASCAECHEVGVHNPKAVPRKPGRPMTHKEALDYWQGTQCWCGKEQKASGRSFGPLCWEKLTPQSQHDLLNTTGSDYIKTMALAEQSLMSWKLAEEQAR